jgi:hypothetical protein
MDLVRKSIVDLIVPFSDPAEADGVGPKPIDPTSAPSPSFATSWSNARLEFAFTA